MTEQEEKVDGKKNESAPRKSAEEIETERKQLLAKAELLARTARRASAPKVVEVDGKRVLDTRPALFEAASAVAGSNGETAKEAIRVAMKEEWRSPGVDAMIESLSTDQAKTVLALVAAFWNQGYSIGKSERR